MTIKVSMKITKKSLRDFTSSKSGINMINIVNHVTYEIHYVFILNNFIKNIIVSLISKRVIWMVFLRILCI